MLLYIIIYAYILISMTLNHNHVLLLFGFKYHAKFDVYDHAKMHANDGSV